MSKPRNTYPRPVRLALSLAESEKSLIARAAAITNATPAKWARDELLAKARFTLAMAGLTVDGTPKKSRLVDGINHFPNPIAVEE